MPSGSGSDLDTSIDQITRIKDIGNSCIKEGNFEQAIKHYSDALELVKSDPATLSAKDKAVLYANRSLANLSIPGTDDHAWDCTQAALADARMAVKIDPTYPKAHHRLGQALKALGDSTGAVAEAFTACKKLRQKELAAKATQASIAAVAAEKQHKSTGPVGASANAQYTAGEAMEDSADYNGAEAAYRAAIALEATHTASHCALGGLLMAVRADYPGAIAAYRAAIALEPGRTEVYSNLCGMLAMSGDFDGAEKAARCLIKLLPPGDEEGSECLQKVLEERDKAKTK